MLIARRAAERHKSVTRPEGADDFLPEAAAA